jgi:CheY-like chemotaxis protein
VTKAKIRILVVDNEPDVLDSLRTSLSLSGYGVVTAATAVEALEICEEQPIDLAIIDFILPKMDGLQLLARIRQMRPMVRSIIISGQIASPTDSRQITDVLRERVQADDYLEKPVSGSDLERHIEALLASEPSSDWKEIGKRMLNGQNAKIKTAAEAAKALKQIKRK